MRTFAFLRAAAFTLVTTGLLTFSGQARATIVVNGKTVSAWPDLAPSEPAPETALDTVGVLRSALFPHPSGVVQGLTILVDFSDQTGAYSKTEIDAWLNTKGYHQFGLTGSIRDYY